MEDVHSPRAPTRGTSQPPRRGARPPGTNRNTLVGARPVGPVGAAAAGRGDVSRRPRCAPSAHADPLLGAEPPALLGRDRTGEERRGPGAGARASRAARVAWGVGRSSTLAVGGGAPRAPDPSLWARREGAGGPGGVSDNMTWGNRFAETLRTKYLTSGRPYKNRAGPRTRLGWSKKSRLL